MSGAVLRICHVTPHLPPDQAANALLPATLGTWLCARGHEVSFVSQEPVQAADSAPRPPSPPGDAADSRTPHSAPHTPHPALAGPVRRLTLKRAASPIARLLRVGMLARAREIRAALDDMARHADIVHLHSNGLIIEVAAEWARRRKRPFVLTLYGTEVWHYRRRPLFDPFTRAFHRADAVTFYSQRLADRARELGLDRPGLSVIYPAVSDAFIPADAQTRQAWREELGIRESQVILNVKRLHELAGQKYLIEAFAKMARSHPDVRLVICGTGSLRDDLEAQARASGMRDRITFTGLVANDRVARYAGVADVFALPSLLEALPTVAIEALAAGTPVISADHPGGEELHTLFGDDVRVVPRRDSDALAAALSAALEHPRRTAPGTGDRLRALFSPDAVTAQYEDLYGRALGAGR